MMMSVALLGVILRMLFKWIMREGTELCGFMEMAKQRPRQCEVGELQLGVWQASNWLRTLPAVHAIHHERTENGGGEGHAMHREKITTTS